MSVSNTVFQDKWDRIIWELPTECGTKGELSATDTTFHD